MAGIRSLELQSMCTPAKSQAVEPGLCEAAAEIRNIFKAAALQGAGCEIAALAFLAINENSTIVRQLAEAVTKFAQWNMNSVRKNAGLGHFALFAHVEKELAVRLPILG